MSKVKCTCENASSTLSGRCFNCYELLQYTGIDYAHGKDKTVKTEYILKSKYDRLEKAAMKLRDALKWAVKDEKEAIFEANGCPGFDGPMAIETKYDKVIAEFDEAIKNRTVMCETN